MSKRLLSARNRALLLGALIAKGTFVAIVAYFLATASTADYVEVLGAPTTPLDPPLLVHPTEPPSHADPLASHTPLQSAARGLTRDTATSPRPEARQTSIPAQAKERALSTPSQPEVRAIPPSRRRSSPSTAPTTPRPDRAVLPLLPVLDHADIREPDRLLANAVLHWLPTSCRRQLHTLVVRTTPDAPRGLGGGGSIYLRGLRSADFPEGLHPEEFVGVLVHECAHLFISQFANTTSPAKGYRFRDGARGIAGAIENYFALSWTSSTKQRVGAAQSEFASGYAATDIHEDFSELYALVLLHHDIALERATQNPTLAEKVAWIEEYALEGVTPLDNPHEATSIPWDITKQRHTFLTATAEGRAIAPQLLAAARGAGAP